jgi:hypothetical protein
VPAAAALPPAAAEYGGWYIPDSPRVELIHFLERLLGITFVRINDGALVLDHLGGWNETYVPVSGMQFRHVPKKKENAPDPVATLELLTPNQVGRFIQAGLDTVIKRIPTWLALTQIVATVFVALSMVAILLYAPFWILGGLSKRRRRPAERGMRLLPLIAVLSLIAFVGTVIGSSDDLIDRLGHLTGWSAAICLATVVFALASLAGALSIVRTPAETVRRGVRRFSLVVTIALLIATVCFAYWGIIGLRTWA